MVQADRRAGKRLSQCRQVADLRMVQPRIEGQIQRRQTGESFSECLIIHQPGRRCVSRVHQGRIGVIRRDVPDTAETPASRSDMRLQHLAGFIAVTQIDMADDAGADFRRAIAAGRAHGRDAVDELGFTHRLERLRPRGAMHRPALHEHGADDVVAAVGVGQQVVEHVQPVRPLPKMVMRIDDRQFGFQDRFGATGQPIVADRQVRAVGGCGAAHAGASLFGCGHSLPPGAGCQVHPLTRRQTRYQRLNPVGNTAPPRSQPDVEPD